MDAATTVAVSKALKSAAVKKASESLTVGKHHVDAMIHVKGMITKSEDELATPTVSLALLETLALFAHHAGITRESAMVALRTAATEALSNDTKTKGKLVEQYGWMDDMITTIKKEVTAQLPKLPKAGKVTTALMVETVEDEFVRKLG